MQFSVSIGFAVRKKNILVTGLPGVGKTTLIKKLAHDLRDFNPAGFYTEEIREGGIRKGFSLASFNGRRGTLSRTDIKSRHTVGKYGVDIAAFEDFLGQISFFSPDCRLVIIDEIGKMECISGEFRKLLNTILDSERPLVATISKKGEGIIAETKKRPDIEIFELTQLNRDSLLPVISGRVRSL